MAYHGFLTDWLLMKAKDFRTAKFAGKPYDLHPWDFLLSILTVAVVGPIMAVVLLLLTLLKLLPIILRAYLNHIGASGNWFRGNFPLLSILFYLLMYPLIPALGALLLPGTVAYMLLAGGQGALEVWKENGDFGAGWRVIKEAFGNVRTGEGSGVQDKRQDHAR